jgi:hypothetical protein
MDCEIGKPASVRSSVAAWPSFLGTSAAAEEVDHYLRVLNAKELVDHITTAADVDRIKPDPDLVKQPLTERASRLPP